MPPPCGHQKVLELEKEWCCAAHSAHNNFWPMESVTVIIFNLTWEMLESHHQKTHLCVLYL